MHEEFSSVLKTIDPTLKYPQRIRPSTLLVFKVERNDTPYIWKAAPLTGVHRVDGAWIDNQKLTAFCENEVRVLRHMDALPGISHLVQDYGKRNSYVSFLKEWGSGMMLGDYWLRGNAPSPQLKEDLEETLFSVIGSGFADLDICYTNILVANDGKSGKFIDLGHARYFPDRTALEFLDAVVRDIDDLNDVLVSPPKMRRQEINAQMQLSVPHTYTTLPHQPAFYRPAHP
jgi:hypothetical protein